MMLDRSRLWAKSLGADQVSSPGMLLPAHLSEVHSAAMALLSATAADQMRALGLPSEAHSQRFRRCVLLAAALHDLGKANDHFQDMVQGKRIVAQTPQGLRHEWVTVLLIEVCLRTWLLPAVGNEPADLAVVTWAIGGHHPKFNRKSPPSPPPAGGQGTRLRVLTGHKDFAACLEFLRSTFQLQAPPELPPWWDLDLASLDPNACVYSQLNHWRNCQETIWKQLCPLERRLVAAVKATVIGADVAGSAALQATADEGEGFAWVERAFAYRPSVGDLTAVVSRRLAGKSLRPFQEKVSQASGSAVLVTAGCGTGKTIAAYQWAATQHPQKRLYFCYPTTGTATEGFRDHLLVSEAFDRSSDDLTVWQLNAKLFHSRAEVDLAVLSTPQDQGDDAEGDTLARIESLESWSTPVVNCTVDTVLGVLQNVRRGLYAWPALAGAAFIFDEIHSYDEQLFAALLRFLEELPGLPALLMTASLPKARLTSLRGTIAGARRQLTEVAGPEELETRFRYRREATPCDIQARVRAELEAGGSVLWVSNTVNRAMWAGQLLADQHPRVYHSRFRYYDRVERHRDVIDAFNGPGALACTTQVAEMSLDLSATLLVTDLAPVPALIQRLGRLNRNAEKDDPVRPFLVIDDATTSLPYSSQELESARTWLASLPTERISQRDLTEAWQAMDEGEPATPCEAEWLDGGPETLVGLLRQGSPSISVLLEEDLPALRCGQRRLVECILPMPQTEIEPDWQRFRGVPVVPCDAIDYDPHRGAQWRR